MASERSSWQGCLSHAARMNGADYRSEDLRRRSFKGQSLESADFTAADLRGVDFSHARLAGASFRDARLGVSPLAGAAMLVGAIAVSVVTGVVAGQSINAVRERFGAEHWEDVAGAASISVVLVVFVAVMFWRGFDTAVKALLVASAIGLVASLIIRLVAGSVDLVIIGRGIGLVLLIALAVISGILARVVGGSFGAWAIPLVALLGGLATGRAEGGLAGLVVMVALVLISKRALHADYRDRTLLDLAHRIVWKWGTRFAAADLTGVDFTGTRVEHSDLRGATTEGARWEHGRVPPSLGNA